MFEDKEWGVGLDCSDYVPVNRMPLSWKIRHLRESKVGYLACQWIERTLTAIGMIVVAIYIITRF